MKTEETIESVNKIYQNNFQQIIIGFRDHNEIVLFKDKQAFFWAQNKNLSKDFACVFWIDKKSKITDIDNSYPLGCGNLIRLIKN